MTEKELIAKSMGPVEAAREGVRAIAPGLSLSGILADVGAELKQQAAAGAHELAAALFNGSGFVMYPRAGKDGQRVEDPQHGPPDMQKQQEHGGREM